MLVSTVLQNGRSLHPDEQCVVDFLQETGGSYNRAGLFGAYSSHSPVRDVSGFSMSHPKLHAAVKQLGNKDLLQVDMDMCVRLQQSELEIFLELSKNFEQYQDMIRQAVGAQRNSWSPYSGFKVGAAVMSTEGEIATGTNFENAAYGSTICAERCAIGAGVKDGILNPQEGRYIQSVAIVLPNNEFGRPCGTCRQVIYEFSKPKGEALVVMANPEGMADVKKISDILPDAFGPFDLGILDN